MRKNILPEENLIGLRHNEVEIVPYKPEWQILYKKEEELIHSALDKYEVNVEHIGSTAVPDLAAKPILDIMIGVKKIETIDKCINPLINLNYRYFGECGRPGRIFFVKERQKKTTHHLHLVKVGSKHWRRNLLFRDLLRKNRGIVEEYAQLKEELAQEFNTNRDAYREGKSEFIDRILAECKSNNCCN